ncbi:hypothetical protein ACFSVK_17070 [Azorhizophilus paspali]|uniref:hypothetical protein n=1 Tax=Azorhizophilus paspali TaxID=69963 RepID=UPI003628BDAD
MRGGRQLSIGDQVAHRRFARIVVRLWDFAHRQARQGTAEHRLAASFHGLLQGADLGARRVAAWID